VVTYCRICPGLCGIVVDVDGDRVVKVSGDPDHPISAGYTCSKGRALPAFHHHPDRLDRPQLRGVDATWDETIGDLAGRLGELVARYGPDCVAAYRATHSAFDGAAQRTIGGFLRGVGTTQRYSSITLDTPNKNLVPDLITGSGYLFPLADWDATRLLLLVGHNPVVSHGHVTTRPNALASIRAVRSRGGQVVVVDPRRTESARLADLHLAIRPGSDAALLAFLVRSILESGTDEGYVAAAVDPDSVNRLRAAVAPFDRATTAERCDVDAGDLDRLVELVRTAGRVSTQTGTGVSMSSAANAAEWLVWAVGGLTGSLDRPGGIHFNPGVLRQQDNGPLTRPWPSGPSPASRPELIHAYGELPCVGLGDEVRAGNVRALLVVGGNPAVVFPDAEATREMLTALDVLAVFDVQRTETTELATHLFPVAAQLERADLPVFLDASYPVPFTQYGNRVVAPAADRRPMWWAFAALTSAMGLPLPDGVAELLDRPGTVEADDEILAQSASRARLPWDDIRSSPHGVVATDAPAPGWLIPDRLPRGRLDLAPAQLVDQLDRWRTAWEPDNGRLRLVNRRLPHQMNSLLRNAESQQRAPHPTLLIHPDDAAALDVDDGALVEVAGGPSRTTARAECTDDIRPGTVSLPHAWAAPIVNALTSTVDDVDPLTGMPRYSNISVTVKGVSS
jgi:anaerobic selenocysteine-containing dehydrogenase